MSHCKVHNVRFYNPELQAIKCTALHNSNKKLVVSRSDASLEIWNLKKTWFVERTIAPTTENFSIEGLVWCGDRLFSVGLHGMLIEYNLKKLCIQNRSVVTGGAAYCIAASSNKTDLAIGTEQGYLNLFKVDEDGASYEKFFDKQEGKIICLKFSTNGEFVVSGSIDTIRIWVVQTGHAIHKMTTGRSEANKATIVWCLEVMDDFTIISGDSRGKLTFWDGKNGSQIESYQTHKADILAVVLRDDQNSLYCAGVDPTIANYERICVKDGSQRWVKSIQRKIHSHDVNALAICDKKLYSGGADGYLQCSFYPPKTLLKMPPTPQPPFACLSPETRSLLLRYPKHMELWSLGQDDRKCDDSFRGWLHIKDQPKKLLVLYRTKKDMEGEEEKEGIICSSISKDGSWIVYSTCSGVRLFQVLQDENTVKLEKFNDIENFNTPCLCANFTADSSSLIIAPDDGGLLVYDLTAEKPNLDQKLETEEFTDVITFLLVSSCNKFLIASDAEGNIVIWISKKNMWEYYCKVPKHQYPPTAMAIHPNVCQLIIAYSDLKIVEYDIKKRHFSSFSNKLSHKELKSRSYPFKHITFDPRADNIIILHDINGIIVINKEKVTNRRRSKSPKLDTNSSSDRSLESSISVSSKDYKHLIHFEWLADDEIVAVEVNILVLMEQLPPAFVQNKFGMK